MIPLVIGIDPSFTRCGVSDGERHEVIETIPGSGAQPAEIKRRCREIVDFLASFIDERECHVFIEGPMAASRDAMHLYELGWLMDDLHTNLPVECPGIVAIHEVPIATLRKWATKKGNSPKDEMKLAVYKKFGIEFERDPGCDRLFAFLLVKYGQGVLAGTIHEVVAKGRGQGRRAKQIARQRKAA